MVLACGLVHQVLETRPAKKGGLIQNRRRPGSILQHLVQELEIDQRVETDIVPEVVCPSAWASYDFWQG